VVAEGWRSENREWWDVRVPVHLASRFYDVEGFKAGRDPLRAFEVEEMGDVTGRSLVHLQCHFGQDTLGWARRGARATGVDFSAPAVEAACRLAEELGLDADFVQSDVYGAVSALGGRTFDVVYTGIGALNWLPDIVAWSRVVADLLAPGGVLYLAEFHPICDVWSFQDMTFERSYFDRSGQRWEEAGTYTDGGEELSGGTWEWTHGVGDVVSALISAGLRLEFLHEHDFTLFARWPFLECDADGVYRFPPGQPAVPLMYSLRASKPPAR
jgi:SAM-dependent methyltransferase